MTALGARADSDQDGGWWLQGRVTTSQSAACALIYNPADLNGLKLTALDRMAAAASEICEWERVLSRTGDNVVGELLRLQETFREWDHFPKGDAYDPESRAQYYYHAHARPERPPGEHGHFHTFVRDEPFAAPRTGSAARAAAGPLCHLVGLSMDRHGRLIRLFTTNQWVTGERWQPAAEVVAKLDWFNIGIARPSWPVNRWVTAVLELFHPQIESLIRARDEIVGQWQCADGDQDPLEDRALTTISEMWVTVPEQVRAVTQAQARGWLP